MCVVGVYKLMNDIRDWTQFKLGRHSLFGYREFRNSVIFTKQVSSHERLTKKIEIVHDDL